jgi:hypothetical protein
MKSKAGQSMIGVKQNMTVNILDSELMKTLPIDSQYSIRKFLQEDSCGEKNRDRELKFRKRDIKLGQKKRQVT